MKENLYIRNFGGLKEASVSINKDFTLFIGPQASGKSVIAKLAFYFKGIVYGTDLPESISEKDTPESVAKAAAKRFFLIFPVSCWPTETFELRYEFNDEMIWIKSEFMREEGKHEVEVLLPTSLKKAIENYLDTYRELKAKQKEENIAIDTFLSDMRILSAAQKAYESSLNAIGIEKHLQYFIVAGRSFFSQLNDNIYPILAERHTLDYILLEFSSIYATAKKISQAVPLEADVRFRMLTEQVLKGKFLKEGDKDFLVHNDQRKVEVNHASSGQQEALPLVLIMNVLRHLIVNNGYAFTVYIEEPEAHLFPASQKAIVELIAYVANLFPDKLQVILTTHSPFVMTSFNNLIQAKDCFDEGIGQERIEMIIPQSEWTDFHKVSAYSLNEKGVVSLMDDELKLISTTALDEVAEQISNEFGKLLEL